MFVGDINKINLSTSSFEKIIGAGALYVDKSRFIEHFLGEASDVQLIARQRRLGKSLNMDMLRCFLTDDQDHRHLFSNLYVSNSPAWEKAHSAPVFLFDFNKLTTTNYSKFICGMVSKYAQMYIDDPRLPKWCAKSYENWVGDASRASEGISLLTEIAYAATGKKSYVLIDEYDKLLMNTAGTEDYATTRQFLTNLLSATLKGNQYLDKALLTGVMRVSYEGMLSGLNNIVVFDVFSDPLYTNDYGLTEEEAAGLAMACGFDLAGARKWYNGIKINNAPIYNTYGVMSMIKMKRFSCYWGNTGTMSLAADIMGPAQKREMTKLLNEGASLTARLEDRISPDQLVKNSPDAMFYSLLVQAGYLALDNWDGKKGDLSIPNAELKDVWERFLLSNFFDPLASAGEFLPYIDDPGQFAASFKKFLQPIMEALSFHDLPKIKYADNKYRTPEIHYHMLLSGLLAAYVVDMPGAAISSNRESGDGRFDILLDFPDRAVILEIKPASEGEDLEAVAGAALGQIIDRRYGADAGKPVTGVGCAFCGKGCAMVGAEVVY